MNLHNSIEPASTAADPVRLVGENTPEADGVSAMIVESQAAFRRDLPALLSQHEGKWVAYHRSTQLGVSDSKARLYEQCLARGLRKGQFLVRSVEIFDASVNEVLFD